jgi:Lon protease-like protein
MSGSEELFVEPDAFSGTARLFPLPNLVLFPHVLQPLHIFEPRYRDLLAEAIEEDRLIAMALLSPGWEADYEGRPPVESTACLGRVATWQQLPDGTYNILLAGLKRLSIESELPPHKSFREARVQLLEDRYSPQGAARRPELQRCLLEAFGRALPSSPETREQINELLSGELSLGTLADIIAYSLELSIECKQKLLAEPNVDRRASQLIEHLHRLTAAPKNPSGPAFFPPEFSAN